MNTWEIAPSIGHRPRAFRLLPAYHQSVHVQLAAVMAALISELGRIERGTAAV